MKEATEAAEVQKTSATVEAKNDAIENSVAKINTRYDLMRQEIECLKYLNLEQAIFLGLPCKHSYFEHGIRHAAMRENLHTSFKFYGVEKDKKTVPEAYNNMPAYAVLAGFCTIEDFLKYEIKETKSGFAVLSECLRSSPFIFDFGWFDYCGHPTIKFINDFVNCIKNNINRGMIGITFDLSVRSVASKIYAKQFSGYKKGLSLHETIVRTIEKEVKKQVKDKKVRLVCEIEYGGGDCGRTTMLTLAYTVNIPKHVVTPIVSNFRETIAGLKLARASTYQTLKRIRASKHFRTSNLGKNKISAKTKNVKKQKTPEEIWVSAAAKRWEKKWNKTMSREKKLKIAMKYGRSVGSFGSMVAQYHGKLGEKRANRISVMGA